MDQCRPLWAQVTFCETAYEAAQETDGLVILTEWNQFRALDLGRLHQLLRRPLIVDLRNIYEPVKMAAAGFEYISVGRPPVGSREPVTP
jgi:UDPglucose 6-dehydrogenase